MYFGSDTFWDPEGLDLGMIEYGIFSTLYSTEHSRTNCLKGRCGRGNGQKGVVSETTVVLNTLHSPRCPPGGGLVWRRTAGH